MLLKVKLNMPYDYETIHAEFEKERWSDPEINYWEEGTRTTCHYPTSPILQSITNFFASDATKKQLIDVAVDSFSGIKGGRWATNADKLFQACGAHANFLKDLPGFRQPIHLDYKPLICTGFMYFNEKDDPNISSYFYSNQQGDNPVRIPTDFATGWFHFNDHSSWHSGGNQSDYTRYTMIFPITLHTGL